ncbi:MAG TPA: hypothetical protein VN280_00440 [Variovorax sp.]|nr:hypothetical protein [Variovorax sp.]
MKDIHPTKRARLTGKGKAPTFLAIPHYILDSPEWAALPGNSLKMLLDLASQYRGINNGNLEATWERLSARGWASKETVQTALTRLEADGWIFKTRQGGRDKRCSLYAVTWWSIDADGDRHSWPNERVARHSWRTSTTPKIGAETETKIASTSPNLGAEKNARKNTSSTPKIVPVCPENRGSEPGHRPENRGANAVFLGEMRK